MRYDVTFFRRMIDRRDSFLFLATYADGRGVAGTLEADVNPYGFWLHSLYVGGFHRRQGVGSMLLGAAEREALILGRRAVSLAVSKDNPALSLYEKRGYVPICDYENGPLVQMVKILA